MEPMEQKSKKILSVGEQVKRQFLLNGTAWIIVGVLGLFDNTVCSIISIVFLMISLYLTLSILLGKREKLDEMATKNLNNATYTSFIIGQIILFVVAIGFGNIAIKFIGIDVNLTSYINSCIYIFIGIEDLIVGLKFRMLED